jgi:hypothetical protein
MATSDFRRKAMHLAHGIYIKRYFFENADEAHEWLDFESDGDAEESFAYLYPDKHGEWQHYRNAWLCGEVELNG